MTTIERGNPNTGRRSSAGGPSESRRLHPVPVVAPDVRDAFLYREDPTTGETMFDVVLRNTTQKMVTAREMARRMTEAFRQNAITGIDVGSSKGTQLGMTMWELPRHFNTSIYYNLVEPDDASVAILRQNMFFLAAQSKVFTPNIIHAAWEDVQPKPADLITCLHTIYHFPSEQMRPSLQKMIDALKPGGTFYLVARRRVGNQVMDLIQKAKKATAEPFNEVTVDDALPHLEDMVQNDPSLVMRQSQLEAEAFLNLGSKPDEAKTVMAFFLQRPDWSSVPARVKKLVLDKFAGRDSVLTQVDGLVEIHRSSRLKVK